MQAFHRLGWLNDGRSYDDALLRLSDLEFGEVPSPAISIRAAKNRKTAGTAERITSPTPLADGDAEVGEVVRTASPIDAPSLPPSEESEEL